MYKCNYCGRTFDELATWNESRGEFWGVMAFESMSGCPFCFDSDYEEFDENADENEEGENDNDG